MKRIYLLIAASSIAITVWQVFVLLLQGSRFNIFIESLGLRNAIFGVISFEIIISGISIAAAIYWMTRVSDHSGIADVLIIAVAYSIITGLPLVMSLALIPQVPDAPPTLLINLLHFAVKWISSAIFSLGFLKVFSKTKTP
ncbi:MAG TPA: hypothetical protein ENI11_04235 [Actinobacteria bacterium]|nr:hypothetical protein [Actinomycetota bacterium]